MSADRQDLQTFNRIRHEKNGQLQIGRDCSNVTPLHNRSKRKHPTKPAPIGRSENMRRIKSANTAPELAVRKLLTELGYRYRLHVEKLPGKPDIVFSGRRKVIFVHGCFWHVHTCKTAHKPQSNQSYWNPKLTRNVERDARNRDALLSSGWKSLVIWECQASSADLKESLTAFLEKRP